MKKFITLVALATVVLALTGCGAATVNNDEFIDNKICDEIIVEDEIIPLSDDVVIGGGGSVASVPNPMRDRSTFCTMDFLR